jgi:hypothetical protein
MEEREREEKKEEEGRGKEGTGGGGGGEENATLSAYPFFSRLSANTKTCHSSLF